MIETVNREVLHCDYLTNKQTNKQINNRCTSMAEPFQEPEEEMRQFHSSDCLSRKKCRCGDPLRRWRVLKQSPNRGRIFLKCQGAWPGDPSGLSPFCLDWIWEDELDPVPPIFSFEEEYILHPDAQAYFYSQEYIRRNRLKILDLTGRELVCARDIGVVRALVHRERRSEGTQTELILTDKLEEMNISGDEFNLRLPSSPYDSLRGSPNRSRYNNRTPSGDERSSEIDYNDSAAGSSPEDD